MNFNLNRIRVCPRVYSYARRALTFHKRNADVFEKRNLCTNRADKKRKILFSEYFLVNNAADISARDNTLNKAHRYVCSILKRARQARFSLIFFKFFQRAEILRAAAPVIHTRTHAHINESIGQIQKAAAVGQHPKP